MNKNRFAPTPPMGWNSQIHVVTEAQIRANAQALAGRLAPWGWEYVSIGLSWYTQGKGEAFAPFCHVETDEYSRMQPDPARFPSSAGGRGFAPLAEYVHSLGLKLGLHIMRGIPREAAHAHSRISGTEVTADMAADPASVCSWNPDMYGLRDCPAGQAYYDALAAQYAAWGVDLLCCHDLCALSRRRELEMLALAVERSGRPMVLSLSPGPAEIERAWHYKTYANTWPIGPGLPDSWEAVRGLFARCELWQDHVEPGCYPDCGPLHLSSLRGFSQEERRSVFTLWCLMGSPLMLTGEVIGMEEELYSLLTNWDVLDMLPCRPRQLYRTETATAWSALDGGSGEKYVVLFNLGEEEALLSAQPHCAWPRTVAGVELWTGQPLTFNRCRLQARVPAHGCRAFRLISESGESEEDL